MLRYEAVRENDSRVADRATFGPVWVIEVEPVGLESAPEAFEATPAAIRRLRVS